MKETKWSAAIAYADPLNIADALPLLAQAGCSELHIDIKDGSFMPGFGLNLETIEALAGATELPLHAHLMIEKPERYIDEVIKAGCSRVTIHVESTVHSHRAIQQIINAGAAPGIAVKPATPLTKLEYLLTYVDFVHVITEERDIAKRMATSGTFDRVKIIRDNLDYNESRATLTAEGYMTAKHAALCVKHGADSVVLDDAVVFSGGSLMDNLETFKTQVSNELAVL